jgi:hypothetical protein
MSTKEKLLLAMDLIESTKPEFPKDSVIKVITNDGHEDSFYEILLNLLRLIGKTNDEDKTTEVAGILLKEFQRVSGKPFDKETLSHAVVAAYFANPRLIARAMIEEKLNREKAV